MLWGGTAIPGAGLREGFGNVKTKSEWVEVGELLKSSLCYFTIHLSQTLKSHEWKRCGTYRDKNNKPNQNPHPRHQNPIFNTGINEQTPKPAADLRLSGLPPGQPPDILSAPRVRRAQVGGK